jgi:ubiquinone/menaquinone biosynthesis C-methylase UbiE
MSSSVSVQPTAAAPPVYNDTTFRSYSPGQVLEYAQRRGGYPQALIDEIITLHTQTGGSLDSILDLGCGPGNATRALAVHFNHATGMDPSAEMIAAAKSVGGNSIKAPIRFMQGEAEICAGIPDSSMDLITAATSAHWFHMDSFWPTAARVLKPGGTVALFTIWRTWCHPATTPRGEEVHQVLVELEQGTLGPFQRAGNWSLMGLYHDLRMPWELGEVCEAFGEEGYRRQVWNEDGRPGEDGTFFCGEKVRTLEEVERGIATISAVTRWREAHPGIADTEEDCVRAAFARIREMLRPDGVEELVMVGPTVLITLKRH